MSAFFTNSDPKIAHGPALPPANAPGYRLGDFFVRFGAPNQLFQLQLQGGVRVWAAITSSSSGAGGINKYVVANQPALQVPSVTYNTLAAALSAAAADGTADAPIYVTPGTYAELPSADFALVAGRQIIGMGEDPGAVQISFTGPGAGSFLQLSVAARLGLRNLTLRCDSDDSIVTMNNASAVLETDRVDLSFSLANTVPGLNLISGSQAKIQRSQVLAAQQPLLAGAVPCELTQTTVTSAPGASAVVAQGQCTLEDCTVTGRIALSATAVVRVKTSSFSTLGGAVSCFTMASGASLTADECTAIYDAGSLIVAGPGVGGASLRLRGRGFSTSVTASSGPYDTIANGLTIVTDGRVGGDFTQPITAAPSSITAIQANANYVRVTPLPNTPLTIPAVRLPPASQQADGQEVVVKNKTPHAVDVICTGAETIDALGSVRLGPYDSLRVKADRTGSWDSVH